MFVADHRMLHYLLLLGTIVYSMGLIGLLTRKHLVAMSVYWAVMLQGALLIYLAADSFHGTWSGQIAAFFGIALLFLQLLMLAVLLLQAARRLHTLDPDAFRMYRGDGERPAETTADVD